MIVRLLALCLVVLVIGACGSTEPTPLPATSVESPGGEGANQAAGSCGLDISSDASDQEIIRAVLAAEAQFMVEQNIDQLMRLWSEDSRVVDAKNTIEDEADDQLWDGVDAIRHRYVRTVFPGAPADAQPTDLEIEVQGDRATVLATTQIGSEVSPAGDRWTLIRVDGCWLIESLTYNLEPVS